MKLRTAILFTGFAVMQAADSQHSLHQARLQTNLTSHSPAGTPFSAIVIGSVGSNSSPLPKGTVVYGRVLRAKSVGLGLVRERASIELEFSRCELPGGAGLPCKVHLVSVDNARERVNRPNQIQGILAASHPHSWLGGVWYRPVATRFTKVPAGLNGAAGMVQSKLAPNLLSAMVIVGSRLALYRLPEPEIELRPGVSFILRIDAELSNPELTPLADQGDLPNHPVLDTLRTQPATVTLANRTPAADIINFAFLGSRSDVEGAFASSGWTTAEPLNAKTMARTYGAFAAMNTYLNAPVSALHYQGSLPDLVFQKSLNTLAMRHHIRIWREEISGQDVWLGAATQDVSIALDVTRMSLTHRIDPNIDAERSIIMNYLSDAGCVAAWMPVPRDEMRREERSRRQVVTDGAMFVLQLRDCKSRPALTPVRHRLKRSFPIQALRRIILESRQYFVRSNAYYWAYRGIRWVIAPRRASRGMNEDTDRLHNAPDGRFDPGCE